MGRRGCDTEARRPEVQLSDVTAAGEGLAALRELVEEIMTPEPASLATELIRWRLSWVQWQEIADALTEE